MKLDAKKMRMLAMILLIIGGLNWGLIGLLNTNLVTLIFGQSILTTIVYILVGISALYIAVTEYKK